MDLPNEGSNFFGSLPLGQLTKTFLTSPDTGMNNLEEQLPSSRIENENGTIDRFGGEIAFERLMDRNAVHIGVIDKPNDLVAEQFRVILCTEVWLSWF